MKRSAAALEADLRMPLFNRAAGKVSLAKGGGIVSRLSGAA